MIRNSVSLIDKDLAAILEQLPNTQLRSVAIAASRFAIERTRLSDPAIDEGLLALESGKYGDSPARSKLGLLVGTLDENQWHLQEMLEQGQADRNAQMIAFQRARAANSVYSALDPDPFAAATNSIYESYHATNDLVGLRAAVSTTIGAYSVDM